MSDSKILKQWKKVSSLPFGQWIFGQLIGLTVPYTASIHPRVEHLAPGHALVRMDDRRSIRNHLKSIHAAALSHLAEVTANLALMSQQPKDTRWIVTGMEVEFVKKARGSITAETQLGHVDWSKSSDLLGEVILKDSANDVVMRAKQKWQIGPAKAA